jgi:hypothetical protein
MVSSVRRPQRDSHGGPLCRIETAGLMADYLRCTPARETLPTNCFNLRISIRYISFPSVQIFPLGQGLLARGLK